MVKINVTTAISDKATDENRFYEDEVNNVVWSKQASLVACFEGVKCDEHPNNNSTVHIIGNGQKMQDNYKVEISDFCCEKFKEIIQLTLADCI